MLLLILLFESNKTTKFRGELQILVKHHLVVTFSSKGFSYLSSSSPGDLIQLLRLDRPESLMCRHCLIKPCPTSPIAIEMKAATKVRPMTKPATLSLSFFLAMQSSMMIAATLGLKLALGSSEASTEKSQYRYIVHISNE